MAGLHVVFYCESILINKTDVDLEFFYQKSAGFFEAEEKNQVLSPLVPFESLDEPDLDELPDRKLHIFDDQKTLTASIGEGHHKSLSDKLHITTVGEVSHFSIKDKE